MSDLEWLVILGLMALLLASLAVVIRDFVHPHRHANDPRARFDHGWRSTFALIGVLCCCLVLSAALAECAATTTTIVAAIVVNLTAQPVALLFLWMGVRKVGLGVFGQIDCAGHRVPEEQLIDLSASDRFLFVGFSIFRGVIGLVMGSAIGAGCGWPLVRWALS